MTTPAKPKTVDPKPKTAALTMPSDPFAILSMQNLDARFAPKPDANTETLTENNTTSHTENNTEEIAEVNTPRRKRAKVEARPTEQPSANTSVRQRIVEDLQKEPVVRKTIDIPASLNERLQDYCAAKRIKTERRVFLVLLENFLEEEGF